MKRSDVYLICAVVYVAPQMSIGSAIAGGMICFGLFLYYSFKGE